MGQDGPYEVTSTVFRNSFERRLFILGVAYAAAAAAVLIILEQSTFTSPDSVLHSYIAASVFNNGEHSKVANIGTVWLPLFHLLLAPLTMVKPLYSSGLAGTVVNGLATGGILVYLARIVQSVTERTDVLYGSIVLFLASGMTAIYAATPMTEQLSIFLGLAGIYYFQRYREDDSMPNFVRASVFVVLATLTRYEFWFVAAAFVVLMIRREVRSGRTYNVAFFHLPLWGGFLWILWNVGLFGDPLAFVASRNMAVSVTLGTPLLDRIRFLVLVLLVGGVTFVLPFWLDRERYGLVVAPAVVFGLYGGAYLLGFHGLLTNLRYGYVLFGMLVPSVVALRRFDHRKTLLIFAVLTLSVAASSGFVLSGAYTDTLGHDRVQERYASTIERPDGMVLLPVRMTYDTHILLDTDVYPREYRDSFDGRTWIAASRAPWNSSVEYVIIPPVGEDRWEEYRRSGPNAGIVWQYHTNETWSETFDRHFEPVNRKTGLYRRINESTKPGRITPAK